MPTARQVYRTIVALDIERFGRLDRDDQARVELRHALHEQLAQALTGAGIAPAAWSATSTGDGLLVLVDPAVETARVLRALLDWYAAGLAARNQAAGDLARLRVRAVVHAGYVLLDAHGAVGEQVTLAFRLLDAQALRRRLRGIRGSLVVGVSAFVYQQVVRHRPLGLDPAAFSPVTVKVKETRTQAWIHPPDGNRKRRRPATAGPAHGSSAAEPAFLGQQPAVSNLAARNPNFTGRDDLLDRLAWVPQM
jgi:hypothetical protein